MEQIQSMEFMRALGLRTQVTVNDCISLLHHLGDRKQPFEARYSLAEELGTNMCSCLIMFSHMLK